MSMWLDLVKIDPALLAEIRTSPQLIDALFDEDDIPAPLTTAVHRTADFFGHDYRLLAELAEDRAKVERNTADWHTAYPWLARATGHDCPTVEAYDFGYGPAHFLTPDEVARVAEGLRAEHWSPGARATHWDPGAEDRDLTELVPFFAKAAQEGKAVLGGVS